MGLEGGREVYPKDVGPGHPLPLPARNQAREGDLSWPEEEQRSRDQYKWTEAKE